MRPSHPVRHLTVLRKVRVVPAVGARPGSFLSGESTTREHPGCSPSYQGSAVLTNALGQPELMARQARRLEKWIEALNT